MAAFRLRVWFADEGPRVGIASAVAVAVVETLLLGLLEASSSTFFVANRKI